MISMRFQALSVCLYAGGLCCVASADEEPIALTPSNAQVVEVAHIYYHLATGEKVITLLGDGQTTPADNGTSGPIWSSMVSNACVDFGYTTQWFFVVDDNGTGTSELSSGQTVLDFGDIPVDTVVDCVHINWVTDHDDVDLNSDGVGDGVVGLGGRWSYWDYDNGREADAEFRVPLISFLLVDLPGDLTDPGIDSRSHYSMDIDLTGSFSNSLVFEIGDSDLDPQGAAFHNADVANEDRNLDGLPDSDIDGDGLYDWSWDVRFFQPGTADLDGDGVIDGDFADGLKPIGINFGTPEGTGVEHDDGSWEWVIDTSAIDAGTGAEDAFAMYLPPDFNGDIEYQSFYWFGGYECSGIPLPVGPGYTPRADFEHQLFGPGNPGGCCPVDLNCDGVINFFDIVLLVAPETCDYNHDGRCNWYDISAWLGALSQCSF